MNRQDASVSWVREGRAGLTTFLTMAYILFVNPSILSTAIDVPTEHLEGQLLSATALAAGFGTLLMGLIAKHPFALAPGMGLNAYFAYTVVQTQGVPWRVALGAVFLSGLVFLVLSVTGGTRRLIQAIPRELVSAMGVGIGLFLALIGAINGGLVVDHPVTLVTLGDVSQPQVLLTLGGLILTATLSILRVPGAFLLGIGVITAVAVLTKTAVYQGDVFGGFTEGWVRAPVWPQALWFELDILGAFEMGILGIVFVFLFVDVFDTAGTVMGLADKTDRLDEEGHLPRANATFGIDAAATTVGACMGTSSTTAYIESAAGLEQGGRTGRTAVIVAGFFFASLFFWPLASAVPSVATAPILILVGTGMLAGLRRIDVREGRVAIPVFLTIIGMPLTFSIANGIALGLLSWTLLHTLSGRARKVHPLMYILSAFIVARYAWVGAA